MGLQPATPIVIVFFGYSRWGAAANDTGACRLAHIGGVEHVPQNVGLYVLFLHKGAKIKKGAETVGYGY